MDAPETLSMSVISSQDGTLHTGFRTPAASCSGPGRRKDARMDRTSLRWSQRTAVRIPLQWTFYLSAGGLHVDDWTSPPG